MYVAFCGQPVCRLCAALADLGLISRRDQLAGVLSGGWRQRRALAACVMHKPDL